nr:MAG TPA: hypothetical protein [Caudoviricetes sp.]
MFWIFFHDKLLYGLQRYGYLSSFFYLFLLSYRIFVERLFV